MKRLLFSILVVCVLFAFPIAVSGAIGDELEVDSVSGHFFRTPIAILWTYQGEGSSSYVIQMRHGFNSGTILPNVFGQLGLIPDAVVGDFIYESNPEGETDDAIWSRITAHYDGLFDYEWLEGRAIYRDINLDAYLGAGVGVVPYVDTWVGGYYLGNDGFLLSGEGAYPITEDFTMYGIVEYYTEDETVEGEIGFNFNETIWISAQNRFDEWIYMAGISQPLE